MLDFMLVTAGHSPGVPVLGRRNPGTMPVGLIKCSADREEGRTQ